MVFGDHRLVITDGFTIMNRQFQKMPKHSTLDNTKFRIGIEGIDVLFWFESGRGLDGRCVLELLKCEKHRGKALDQLM